MVALVVLALASVLLVGGEPVHAQTTVTTVRMVDFSFDPVEITVPVGSTVTWVYEDMQCDVLVVCPGHDTRAEVNGSDGEPLWTSDTIKGQGMTFTATMTQVGEIPYICTIHQSDGPPLPDMDAKIIVVGAAGPGASSLSGGGAAATDRPASVGGARHPATGAGVGLLTLGLVMGAVGVALRAAARPQHASRR